MRSITAFILTYRDTFEKGKMLTEALNTLIMKKRRNLWNI